jgi:hypothetical protein
VIASDVYDVDRNWSQNFSFVITVLKDNSRLIGRIQNVQLRIDDGQQSVIIFIIAVLHAMIKMFVNYWTNVLGTT